MESEERIIKSFKDLGIKGNAVKAYLALLKIGPSTATRITQFSGVPQPRTYDILNYLQERGFVVVQKVGRRNIYSALKPRFALSQLMEHLRSKEAFLRDSLSKLETKGEVSSPEVWLIKGKNNIAGRIREILEESEMELFLAVPFSLLKGQLLISLRDAARRGVSISTILYSDSDIPAEDLDRLRKWASIRQRRVFTTVLAITDHKLALVLSRTTKIFENVDYAIYTEDPGLMHILSTYFYEILWLPSEIIAKEETKLRNFVYIWRATEVLKVLMEEGKEVRATIEGREIKTGKETHLEGIVRGTTIIHPTQGRIGIYSIIIEGADGQEIKVGGRGAMLEDVQAFRITLQVQK